MKNKILITDSIFNTKKELQEDMHTRMSNCEEYGLSQLRADVPYFLFPAEHDANRNVDLKIIAFEQNQEGCSWDRTDLKRFHDRQNQFLMKNSDDMNVSNVSSSTGEESQYTRSVSAQNSRGLTFSGNYPTYLVPSMLHVPNSPLKNASTRNSYCVMPPVYNPQPVTYQQNGMISQQQVSQGFISNRLNQSALTLASVGNSNISVKRVSAPQVRDQHCLNSLGVANEHRVSQSYSRRSSGNTATQQESADGNIYQVHFKRAHRNFLLSHHCFSRPIRPGDFVKVEADRGEDMGVVVSRVPASDFDEFVPTAGYRGRGFSSGQGEKKFLLRLATPEERNALIDKVRDEEKALEVIRAKVRERRLPMVVLDAEYQFDRHKLIFFFESDRRIDFRELVSELFSLYKTRIWMQQVDTSVLPDHEARVKIAEAAGFLPQSYPRHELYNYSDPETLSTAPPVLSTPTYCSLPGANSGLINTGLFSSPLLSPTRPPSMTSSRVIGNDKSGSLGFYQSQAQNQGHTRSHFPYPSFDQDLQHSPSRQLNMTRPFHQVDCLSIDSRLDSRDVKDAVVGMSEGIQSAIPGMGLAHDISFIGTPAKNLQSTTPGEMLKKQSKANEDLLPDVPSPIEHYVRVGDSGRPEPQAIVDRSPFHQLYIDSTGATSRSSGCFGGFQQILTDDSYRFPSSCAGSGQVLGTGVEIKNNQSLLGCNEKQLLGGVQSHTENPYISHGYYDLTFFHDHDSKN